LDTFHSEAQFEPAQTEATLTPPTTLVVPEGTLAEVTVELGTNDDPDGAPALLDHPDTVSHKVALMVFGHDDITPASATNDVVTWAKSFTDAKFLVIGRCDDVDGATFNTDLARDRANAVRSLLVANGVPEDKVFARGEQTSWAGAGQPAGAALEDQIALRHVESDDSLNDTGIPNPGWLIFRDGIDRTGWPTNRDVNHESEPIRAHDRQASHYAVAA